MILFRTPGTLEPESITTFGLSSKDEAQIGRFGTGLKYATAIVLRLGGRITLRTPERALEFGIEPGIFRAKPVAFATLDGARLPFTTELGRDWKPWMAFREFYANTVDEGGCFYRAHAASELPATCPAHTDFIIDCPEFDAVHDNFEEFFIDPDDKPIYADSSFEVYHGAASQVFYRGFAVMHLQQPARFRYNILAPLSLTEDRTASSAWEVFARIECGLRDCEDADVLREALAAAAEFESALDFGTIYDASATFLGVTDMLGDAASASAMLAAAHTKHRRAKRSGEIFESAEASSGALVHALAHLRIIGAPLEGWKFAFAAIPSGARFDCDNFRKQVLIDESCKQDADEVLSRVLAAYMQGSPGFAHKRLLKLAQELGKKLEA